MGVVVQMRPPAEPGGAGLSCVVEERANGSIYLVKVHGRNGRATFLFHDINEVRAFAERAARGWPLDRGATG